MVYSLATNCKCHSDMIMTNQPKTLQYIFLGLTRNPTRSSEAIAIQQPHWEPLELQLIPYSCEETVQLLDPDRD